MPLESCGDEIFVSHDEERFTFIDVVQTAERPVRDPQAELGRDIRRRVHPARDQMPLEFGLVRPDDPAAPLTFNTVTLVRERARRGIHCSGARRHGPRSLVGPLAIVAQVANERVVRIVRHAGRLPVRRQRKERRGTGGAARRGERAQPQVGDEIE